MAKKKPEPFKQKQGEQVRSSNSNLRFDPFPWPGPTAFWLYFDSDDAGTNLEWNKKDNHGDAGGNVAYADGHAAWVPNKKHNFEWNRTRDLNKFPQ